VRSVSNPKRAATWTVAAIAVVGIVVGLGIAATTRSVNGPGSLAAPAPAPDPGPASSAAASSAAASPAAASPAGPTPASSVAGLEPTKAATTGVADPPTRATPSPHDPASTTTTSAPPPMAPGQCTADDVTVTTATDASAYGPDGPVTITTTIRDALACVLDPVPTGPYDCGTSVTVDNGTGARVWPVPGQSEQCAQPPATALSPGAGLSVGVVWTGLSNVPGTGSDLPAPPGEYVAAGTWSWAGPSGQTVTVTGDSPPFALA